MQESSFTGYENVFEMLLEEIFTGYAGTKIFALFESKLVVRSFPVILYLSMRSYQMLYWHLCGT